MPKSQKPQNENPPSNQSSDQPEVVEEQVEVIFFAPASKHQIGGWPPERREYGTGRIESREGAMRFSGHLKVTSDPREIDFIRKSKSFLNGLVKECVDMRQAKLLIRRVELEKQTARSITQVETTAKDIV